MSAQTNDGGPAFPVPMFARISDGQPMCASEFGLGGMTLRDYFAAQVAPTYASMVAENGSAFHGIKTKLWDAKSVARVSYAVADAMLAQRSIEKEKETR